MDDTTALPVAGGCNLYESVMSEVNNRVEKVPAVEKNQEECPSEDEQSSDPDSSGNGIAEYSAYCKKVGSPSNRLNDHSKTMPVRNMVEMRGDLLNGFVHKHMTPPIKPKRRKKAINALRSVHAPKTCNTLPMDEKRISSELQEIIESAFSTSDEKSIVSNPSSPVKGDEAGNITHSNTLTRETMTEALEQTPRVLVQDTNNGEQQRSPHIKYIDESDDVEEHIRDRPVDKGLSPSINVDTTPETASLWSGLSDEDSITSSLASRCTSKQAPDAISNLSFASEDPITDGKANGKGKQAKAKAKHLKKQAVVQLGAVLDAAGNATERFKKLRKQSIRLPHGKKRSTRAAQTKNAEGQSISNISNPVVTQSNGNAFNPTDDPTETKPLPPTRHASLLSPLGQRGDAGSNQQVAIKCGYLRKQGGMIKTWNERWFVLKGDQLHYYKDNGGKCIASIFLPGNRIVMHPIRLNDNNKFVFEIFPGSDRTKMSSNHESYLLSANSQTEMEEWVKVIRRVILSPFGGGIFGQRLDETMRYDRRLDGPGPGTGTSSKARANHRISRLQAPIIVENCVEYIRSNGGLQEEGLFRLPGDANEVKDLQDAYDMGERPMFPRTTDVHTVTSLLKSYLRELPEPVIPFERYDFLITAAKISQSDEKIAEGEKNKNKEEARKIIKEQLNLLPQPNFDLLRYLCRFLNEVQQNSQSNKMDVSNLAMVFGPTVMRPKRDDPHLMISEASHVQHVMYLFITHHRFLFPDDEKTMESNSYSTSNLADNALGHSADAGIGTLTTTASPLGTLGQRHATDDSGTGSLGPTPENTNKRVPPIPSGPPPALRSKPSKPFRRKVSDISQLSSSDEQRSSLYDNVTASSHSGNGVTSKYVATTRHSQEWRRSNGSGDAYSETSASTTTATTGQGSYYVNNRTTPSVPSSVSRNESPRSSTNAVAGSVGSPDSRHSSPATEMLNSRSRGSNRGVRQQKLVRPSSRNTCLTDEESNTESVMPYDHAFSTLSSHRSSIHNDLDGGDNSSKPRSYSSPNSSRPFSSRQNKIAVVGRLSIESGSDGASSVSSVPTVPSRPHRRTKKEDGSQSSGSQRNSKTEIPLDIENTTATSNSNRTSQLVSSASTSVCGRSCKDMEDEIRILKDELQKQRQEHEKRSRMLEEHYIMKMRSSASTMAPFSSTSYSPFPIELASQPLQSTSSIGGADDLATSPSFSNPYPKPNFTEGSINDSTFETPNTSHTALSRRQSIESQSEMRYREEMKRHAITKIRLRNAERGLQQAEDRNKQLQKEMEDFFETFGNLLPDGLP